MEDNKQPPINEQPVPPPDEAYLADLTRRQKRRGHVLGPWRVFGNGGAWIAECQDCGCKLAVSKDRTKLGGVLTWRCLQAQKKFPNRRFRRTK